MVLPPREATVREYELVYIVTPRKAAAEVDTVITWIGDQVTAAGGEVLSTHNWGRRRLAYPINRDFEGTYVYTTLRMPTLATAALESAMHITEDVIRHLLIRGIMPYDGSPPPEFVGERPRTAPRPTAAPAAEQPTSASDASSEEPAAEPAVVAEPEADAVAAPEAEVPVEDAAADEAAPPEDAAPPASDAEQPEETRE